MKHLRYILYVCGVLAAVMAALRLFMPFRQIWAGWKKIAHRLGVWQARFLLTCLYFLVIPFFALVAGRKRLRLKWDPTAASYWEEARPLPHSLEEAGRPF